MFHLWCLLSFGLVVSASERQISVGSCSEIEWQCADGSCISSTLRCDGSLDCYDGSDESHCRTARSTQGCVVPEFPNDKTYLNMGSDVRNAKPGDVYDHLFINVTCQEGYGVNGSSQFFCYGGQWGPTSQISKCVRQCRLPTNPAVEYQCLLTGNSFGLRACNEFEFEGTEVVPACRSPTYYAPLSLKYMRCQGGKWLHQPLCVPDCGTVTPVGKQLIIDGKRAKHGEMPWHAGIYDKGWTPYKQICGGSIISTQIILSAAHCFWSEQVGKVQPADKYAVAVGKLYRPWMDSNDDAQKSDVLSLHLSDHYTGSSTHHQDDIAVVVVTTAIEYKVHVRPVCLDFNNILESTQLVPGNEGKIAGWGLSAANGTSSQVLQVIELPYVSTSTCYANTPLEFHPYITSDKFCAGYKHGGKALCQGDSGGGLAFRGRHLGSTERYYLRGITSSASNNKDVACNPDTYTAFTLVHKHEHFIKRYWTGEDDSWQTQARDSEATSIANCVMPYSDNITIYKAINVPYAAPGGAYNSIDLEITCGEGYSLESFEDDNRIGCYNGTWWPSQKIPQCSALCRVPKLPGTKYLCATPSQNEGKREFACEADKYVPSGTVSYHTCGEFYEIEQSSSRTMICKNGEWPERSTRCVGVCRRSPPTSRSDFNSQHTLALTPWYAGIYSKTSDPYEHVCGGTIISERLILSAASCFWKDGKQLPADMFAVAASKNHRSWGHVLEVNYVQTSDVETVYLPDYFKAAPDNYPDDISVLLLTNSLVYTRDVMPACLDFVTMGFIVITERGKIATFDGDDIGALNMPPEGADPCLVDPSERPESNICVDNTANKLCSGAVGTGWVFTLPMVHQTTERFFVKAIALKKTDCSSNNTIFTRLEHTHKTFIFDVFRKHKDLTVSIQGMYSSFL